MLQGYQRRGARRKRLAASRDVGASASRRLEEELRNARVALKEAVDSYIDCRHALADVLGYLDHPPQSWMHADVEKLNRAHKLAAGG